MAVPKLIRREPLIFVLALAGVVAYAVYGVWAHVHFRTEFDLSIFDQVVWRYSHFQSPVGTIAFGISENELADHFSPILALLAPLYWIWPDPRMLVIAQGALLGASVVPVLLFARPRLGRVGAHLLAAGYALFWGISAAVGYQFHELAFAPLLIGLAIYLADRERWHGFWLALAALLLVKENMSVLVIFIGLWLLTRREYRRGLVAIAIGSICYVVVLELVIPALAPAGHGYAHWKYSAFGPNLPGAIQGVVSHPGAAFSRLVNDPQKVTTLVYLAAPFLALGACSPLVLLCVPLIAQQLYSSDTQWWGTRYHYWLAIAPVLAMAAADGLHNLLRLARRERWTARIGAGAGAAMLIVNLSFATEFPLWRLVTPGLSFARSADEQARYDAIGAVPPGASVTTQAPLLPHLSQRPHVYLLGMCLPTPTTRYVVVNLSQLGWPNPKLALGWVQARRAGYDQVFAERGWTVLRRRPGVPETPGPKGNGTVC